MIKQAVIWLAIVSLVSCHSRQPVSEEAKQQAETIAHSVFIAGPDFTGILDESDEVVWDAERPAARDGYVLSNGNVLICWSDVVREFTRDKQVVFEYKLAPPNEELGTAIRLDNGRTLISELGEQPRLLEVDQDGVIQIEVPLQPETDNVHMQTRMARKLTNGNYLVPHLLAFAVKEYNPEGDILNVFKTDLEVLGGAAAENWPFTAIRLSNGNTVISLTHGNKVIEVDQTGSIVWKIGNEDLDENVFQDPCGAQRLPNGNTVIASYGAKEGIKLFEVTPEKEMVWHYDGNFRVHHFQILSTNGEPLTGSPLK